MKMRQRNKLRGSFPLIGKTHSFVFYRHFFPAVSRPSFEIDPAEDVTCGRRPRSWKAKSRKVRAIGPLFHE